MSDFWEQDQSNEGSFRDGPADQTDEVYVSQTMTNPRRVSAPAAQQTVEELVEEVSQVDEEDNFEAILADANLRIEQGTLYKMIMNSDLFSQMDVDQRAIHNVQREIRKFAKERMEIMLGMRQEVAKESMVSSPFNDLEVSVLKKLASAATKGASEAKEVRKPEPGPSLPKKTNTLTQIGPQKTTPKKAAAPEPKPIANKQQPIKRQVKTPATIEDAIKSALEEGYDPLNKTIGEMTEEEIIQRNKDSAARQALRKAAKSSTSLPTPSVDQMNMMNQMRATDALNDPGLAKLVNMVKAKS